MFVCFNEKNEARKGTTSAAARFQSALARVRPRRSVALPGRRSRPRAAPVAAGIRRRRDFRVGGILNAAMAQTVQNVTLSLTLPITCHICLGKVMGDSGDRVGRRSPEPRAVSVRSGDAACGAETGGDAQQPGSPPATGGRALEEGVRERAVINGLFCAPFGGG